jgi:dihydroorotate dehydrogenase electron transfer subunit
MCKDEAVELPSMSTALPKPIRALHRPRVVTILDITPEAANTKSLSFKDKLGATAMPGQFGMIWAPGIDEVPMSLLPRGKDDIVTIIVKERGNGTGALLRKKKGDLIGVRGPYGKGFTYASVRNALMIGGGTGAIPLLALVRMLAPARVKCSFILGAHNNRELLFQNEIERLCKETGGSYIATTDDGSAGTRGLATHEAAKVLRAGSFDRVYTCGPEAMMRKIIDLAGEAQIRAEAGLERIFKCGSGICGSCCIGPYTVCKDGPVFSSETLRELPEFGKSTRDASGRPVAIKSS